MKKKNSTLVATKTREDADVFSIEKYTFAQKYMPSFVDGSMA